MNDQAFINNLIDQTGQSLVLATNLYIPTPRADLVSRPRLVALLNEGLDGKLILITAPAGFGKTTLLSEWIATGNLADNVAWLSMDMDDNDPRRFWAHILAAIQVVRPDTGVTAMAALQLDRPLSIKLLLTSLINELAGMSGMLILILDDYHLISQSEIHDRLAFFMEHLPPSLRLVVSSRTGVPWPIARLRARREVAEVQTHDLRFTLDESVTFLNQAMGLGLTVEDVATLDTQTEGWIAGLQMAALSMKDRDDRSGFVRAFRGTHRHVLDYLVEEVLDRQEADVQKFLLKSSILDRLSGSLCDAVVGSDSREQLSFDTRDGAGQVTGDVQLAGGSRSQRILERLEIANLFVLPLDDERSWYRYHHLFTDLLRARLAQTRPDEIPGLHQRASAWYEGQGLIPEAVKHAVTAGDLDTVERLIAGNAFAMVHQSNLNTVASWLDSVPESAIRDRPWLKVTKGWVLFYSGQLEELEQLLREFDPKEDRQLSGHIAAMSSVVASYKGDRIQAVSYAREALVQLPKDDRAARGFTTGTLAYLLFENGELAAAAETLDDAIAISKAAGDTTVAIMTLCDLAGIQFTDTTVAIMTLCDLAGIQFTMGKLRLAAATCREALALGQDQLKQRQDGQTMPVAGGCAYHRMSQVLQEWNDLDGALQHAKEHTRLYEQGGWSEGLVNGSIRLADIYRSLGEFDRGHEAIHAARQLAGDYSPGLSRNLDAHESRLWLAEGDMVAASLWADENVLLVTDSPSFRDMFPYLVQTRLLIAQGKLEHALELLANLLSTAEEAKAGRYIIELLLLQALVRQLKGESRQALSSMERALTLAEPEGYTRSFIEPGPVMADLLRGCIAEGIAVTYAGKLLDAIQADGRDRAGLPTSGGEAQDLRYLDPLSERELEVLRLLTTSLTQREIAEELFISLNTLRSHVKSIYSKLNVHNRMAAVRRAQDLDLLG
jgi:LuxR family maltose regulon positive regulatory protein